MKSNNTTWSLIVFFILIFGNAGLGHAAATVTASGSGNGRFVVQGDGFAGVEGIKIDIQYDQTALTNLRVTQQGSLISGMPMVTHNDPGLLVYTGVDPFPKTRSGSGTIAEISFDTVGNPSTKVTGTATLKDPNGLVLLVQTFVVPVASNNTSNNGSGSSAATGTTTTDGTNTGSGTSSVSVTGSGTAPSAATGTTNSVSLGGVNMPGAGTAAVAKIDDQASPPASEVEKTIKPTPDTAGKEIAPPTTGVKINDHASPPASESEKIQKQTTDAVEKVIAPPTAKAVPPTPPQEINAVLNKSVLEQFHEFQGEKSSKNLIALFRSAMAGNTQDPPLALSDGKAIVKVFVDLPATGKVAPNFALKEAKLVSLKKSGDSAWVVEVLPNKGTFEATVIVLQDDKTVSLPLTIAPPLSADSKIGKRGVLTEVDFNTYLKERGTEKAPRFDLNGDGKRDYIDDYIFTVNFLAKAEAVKAAADKKSQGAK